MAQLLTRDNFDMLKPMLPERPWRSELEFIPGAMPPRKTSVSFSANRDAPAGTDIADVTHSNREGAQAGQEELIWFGPPELPDTWT